MSSTSSSNGRVDLTKRERVSLTKRGPFPFEVAAALDTEPGESLSLHEWVRRQDERRARTAGVIGRQLGLVDVAL